MPTPDFNKRKTVTAQDRAAAIQTLVNFIEAHDEVTLLAVASKLNADPTVLVALVRASVVMLGAAAGDPHMRKRLREGQARMREMDHGKPT